VECADLEQLVAGPLLQPAGEARVERRAGRLGKPLIGDLANEDMLELERVLAGDRGACFRDDQVAHHEAVHRRLQVVELRRQVCDRALPEDAPDERCTLQHAFLDRREPVDARSDQRLQRVRDRAGDFPLAVLLDEHPDHLLDEQRVALRDVEDLVAAV
jgi:hypothetical protein